MVLKRHKVANLGIWFLLVASMLLLAFVCYQSEFMYNGKYHEKYFKYYMISLAGIFFWGFTLRLKDEIKLNIFMVGTSVVGTIYLVEIALSFIPMTTRFNKFSLQKSKTVFDMRNKFEVYLDLKNKGIDSTVQIHPKHWLTVFPKPLNPLAGISKKTTVACNESGKFLIYLSDRYGFVNPDSEWDAPEVEWMLIGDSFTQGYCVEPKLNIAGRIRSVTDEKVVNLGMAGNGLLLELAALKEYAPFKRPKKVLWLYYEGNDLGSNLKAERLSPTLMNYINKDFTQNLINRQEEIDSMLGDYFSQRLATEIKRHKVRDKYSSLMYSTRILRLVNLRRRISFDIQNKCYIHLY